MLFHKMRFLRLLIILFIPFCVVGQEEGNSNKTKKEVGQQTLTIDLGLFHDVSHYQLGPSQGFILGVEKKRQRFLVGLTFAKNIFYSDQSGTYGLTGFIADYSFIFFQPIKCFGLAISTQFQYNYQDRVIYYAPPAEALIMVSRYQESIYGLFGLEARVKIFKNFYLFGKLGAGIESRKSQTHYPYYPPYNKYKKKTGPEEFLMFGLTYGFPTTKKLLEQ
jgi:hypothetical protein